LSYEIDYFDWQARPKSPGISGCFRLRNESEFMRESILSHLDYLDEAILVVQPSEDATVEIAYELAGHYDKIRVYEYPYYCAWIDTPRFYSEDPGAPGHLVHMSNWALSKCTHEWICKTEGDVICLSSFKRVLDVLDARRNDIYYGRVLLNLAGVNCDMISFDVPRNGGFDVGVFYNDPRLWHFERVQKWEMVLGPGQRVCMGWSGLHTKRCKSRNIGWNNENYVPFIRENVRETLKMFNRLNPYPGPDDPLGEDCLYEHTLIT